jgi:hypothetical protein
LPVSLAAVILAVVLLRRLWMKYPIKTAPSISEIAENYPLL